MELNEQCTACKLRCTSAEADHHPNGEIDYVDPCLGHLPGVRYACCGHGVDHGYIFFENGVIVRGSFELIEKQMYNLHNDFSVFRP